ncbi:MAG: hypothetical protein PHU80_00050 [Kiritimatiellae bacterium]|nr:hypothetical protein [Kiritimatiellia bacterium]
MMKFLCHGLVLSAALALPVSGSPGKSAGTFSDINALLSCSPRDDLIGPEMWTAWRNELVFDNGNSTAFIGGQLPHYAWSPPKPGLNGHLHILHGTAYTDPIQIEITEIDGENSAVLQLVPTRNTWTPALLTTYYRSRPNTLGTDYIKSGGCALKETKCITRDNVFISEMEISNCSPVPRVYNICVSSKMPALPVVKTDKGAAMSGSFAFDTFSFGRKTPRKGFSAMAIQAEAFTWRIMLSPWEKKTVRYAFAVDGLSAENALTKVQAALADAAVFNRNVSAFNRWFADNVPELLLDNPDLLKMYYYRWFVVYRSIHEARRLLPDHEYPRPVMYESPAGPWYGCVIGLPVPMQILEAAWLRDSTIGWNHILNWAEKVHGYRGYVQFTPMAVWKFYRNHPNKTYLNAVFEAMKAFALEKAKPPFDRLPVQRSSWEPGAEYSPNFYQFTAPPWDYRNDMQFYKTATNLYVASLIRLDTAGYTAGSLSATSKMAGLLGKEEDRAEMRHAYEKMLSLIKRDHWDQKLGMFLAADPASGQLADQAACYDSFVPFMWGMAQEPQYQMAFDKLFDPAWFWDEFPFTTAAKNCPMYFDGNAVVGPTEASLTKPSYYGCSWNGPTWNYANTLYAEALGQGALQRAELRDKWVDFFIRWSDMHFLYGDKSVPCATEHHRPNDGARFGRPAEYFHSSWLDPFYSYWCGIRLGDDLRTLTFDPFTREPFTLHMVKIADGMYTFEQTSPDADGQRMLRVMDEQGRVLGSARGQLTINITGSSPAKL